MAGNYEVILAGVGVLVGLLAAIMGVEWPAE